MNFHLRVWTAVLLLASTAGCAGGWRTGAPPASPANVAAAPAATTASGTHATEDGVLFVWKGEGGSVNVAGEFNSWSTSADPLHRDAKGGWSLAKKLAPGKYAYKFVIDGSNWKSDPTVTDGVDDGYGGKNSVVVVGPRAAAPAVAAATAPAAVKGGGPAVTADGVVFRYSGMGNAVNLAGEFNAWSTSADPMTKGTDGVWTLTKKLAPGNYAYKFVIDGATWKEDPNATQSVDDGYGGKNSVIAVGGGKPAAAPAAAAPTAPAAAAPAAGGSAVFRYVGEASSVNLAGEFNSWSTTADPMTKAADGSWTISKPLAPGKYAYKFVIDGSKWKEDATATQSVDDGYGGKNSVIVVGGAGAAAAPAPAAPAVKPLAAGVKPRAPEQGAAGVVFTFAGAAAHGVSLCGDFNAWSTTSAPLSQQDDGSWTITMKLAPGTYAYKFLVDGTTWKPDEGNTQTRDDGFGGKNSVVSVK